MVLIVIMGVGMNLITFSLFGDNPLYCVGAVENARLAKEIYPDWTARFYVAQDVPSMYLDAIEEYGGDIVHCEKKNSYDGLNWRFRPLTSLKVDYWISRDADSRLSWRERNAVDEWMKSDKTAHLLRDSHNHGFTIMAGMFGINNKLFHERYGMFNLDNTNADYREADQTLLQEELWPLIKHDHLCHDHWKNSENYVKKMNEKRFVGLVGKPKPFIHKYVDVMDAEFFKTYCAQLEKKVSWKTNFFNIKLN